MTNLAIEIMRCMDDGVSCSVDILARGIGSTEAEVEFIMEQIKIARGE